MSVVQILFYTNLILATAGALVSGGSPAVVDHPAWIQSVASAGCGSTAAVPVSADSAGGINPGGRCIPCSETKPCEGALLVCTFNGTGGHGCCLGYAN